jgi:hypothetical protein
VKYNNSFFENYGMPKFAVTVTGDFADYDEEPYNADGSVNEDYDITQTLRYKIGQQIKEVIKHPHSAICITIPSEGEEGNVELKITPLSVQTEEGHFRMLRKDTRDEVLHAHHVDPSRLGIYDAGSLNGSNSDNTRVSYKYGTVAPIKAEIEGKSKKYDPNTDLSSIYNNTNLDLAWEWAFEGAAGSKQTDDKDTKLGNIAVAIQLDCQIQLLFSVGDAGLGDNSDVFSTVNVRAQHTGKVDIAQNGRVGHNHIFVTRTVVQKGHSVV